MKLGICAWVLPGGELDAFKIASNYGLDGVVIDFGALDDQNPLRSNYGQETYKEEAKKYNLEIPTLALNLLCEKGITRSENLAYGKALLDEAVAIAKNMNISKLQIPSFYDNLIRTDEDLSNTIEFFKYACQLGEKNKVIMGTESVMTIVQHKRLYDEVNSKVLTTLYDTQNPWRMMNQDGVKLAEAMLSYTGELHAKDGLPGSSKDILLGEGDVRYKDIMSLFAKSDFNAWVQLESSYNTMNDFDQALKEDIINLKALFSHKVEST